MKPIELLFQEHRLIERVVKIVKNQINKMDKDNPDIHFIDSVSDFFKTYTDDTHHGKEEGILFRELGRRAISENHKDVMADLLKEHVEARNIVKALNDAKEKYINGDKSAFEEMKNKLIEITEFYPPHIDKEDKHFFEPAMEYFTEDEIDQMLKEFWEYDREMIHRKYRKIVEKLEK